MINKGNSRQNSKKRIKSEISDSARNSRAVFLKKYEIIIMLLGAGIISVLIFFVFLKPSEESNLFKTNKNNEQVTVKDFQNQIDRLANMVEKVASNDNKDIVQTGNGKKALKENSTNSGLAGYEKRLERIEASLSIKYETLASRIKRLERSIDKLSRKVDSDKISSASVVKRSSTKTSKKQETKKNITPKKESIFHTVTKGDTLYSLSKLYGTSVAELEKMNHLPKDANIYPGDNLLVK
ncbi:MAG: LysM peptidoglycan-binding domain-containing protein [Desulfobacteraceae bacterium]|nr:LysM peptidoglycan-binding domain-containing protein [Desulfobacteraceae bacterium]